MPSARLVRRELASGVRYYAKYRDNNGNEHMKLAGTKKKDANDFLVELKKELKDEREGRAKPKADMETTVSAWCLAWVEGVVVKEHTRAEYRRILNDPAGIVGKHGSLPLGALQRTHIKAWMAARAAEGASRNTVRNGVAVVRAALSDAVDEGKLLANPATLPKKKGKRSVVPGRAPLKVTPPAQEDVDKILANASQRFRVILLLAASSGLRCGEVYGLKWADLAADSRTVSVSRSNNRGQLVSTKSEAGERIVPLFGTVRAALLEWRLASAHSQDDDLIFPDELGRPAYATHANDRDLQATFRKAGLAERAWRFHALRHFAVSKLIEQGAAITLIAKVAGHSDPSITLSTYSHLMPTGAAEAADKYDPMQAVAN